VHQWEGIVQLSGFDLNDIGTPAYIRIYDIQGVVIREEQVTLEESVNISTPQYSGLYCLQVVSVRNRYGAMIVVQ
jgi:hypothetical protein